MKQRLLSPYIARAASVCMLCFTVVNLPILLPAYAISTSASHANLARQMISDTGPLGGYIVLMGLGIIFLVYHLLIMLSVPLTLISIIPIGYRRARLSIAERASHLAIIVIAWLLFFYTQDFVYDFFKIFLG